MIIILKDYDFSHESIFQTIKVITGKFTASSTSKSIRWVESTVQHQNALRQLYYEHHAKEAKSNH